MSNTIGKISLCNFNKRRIFEKYLPESSFEASFHTLYEVKTIDLAQVKLFKQVESVFLLDVWINPTPDRAGQVLVPSDQKEYFEKELFDAGIELKVIVENIKDILDFEDKLLSKRITYNTNNNTRNNEILTRIPTYEEVAAYLQEIARTYPDIVSLENGGKSFEGRDIWYLKISTTKFQDPSKPVVFMQSLLHAREWITLPATLYAIHKLVVDVSERDVLQDVDWIIMPIANPDGYVFSHAESRFWRKNRANNFVGICAGVDLNRNFDVNWGEASSSISCMDTFHGPQPFSEPETRAIRDIMLEHGDRLELFLDIHSFGSMILFGHGNGVLPPNGLILNLLGVQMAQAIDAVKADFNPNYVVGNVAHVLYDASGSAMDYAKVAGAPFAYTYELPGLRLGVGAFGFLVDPSFIPQGSMETWEGIKVGARFVRDLRIRKFKGII
ncbi:unnamed protein product [Diatraea saccharalis]|uniref:Peptidase M14 domain-containing protein n=1 Tax=Diatraea saccharalis TaxID=40085 RepID=A0A9N9N3U1_9NEOP|nr:unnamed protein product [Diatraea saccharalis]